MLLVHIKLAITVNGTYKVINIFTKNKATDNYAHYFRFEEPNVIALTLWYQPDVVLVSVCTSAWETTRESVEPPTKRPSTIRLKRTCLNAYCVRVYSHQAKAKRSKNNKKSRISNKRQRNFSLSLMVNWP